MSQESPADDKSGEEWKRCIESGDAGINFGLFTMGVVHWKARSGSLVSRVFVILNVWLVLCIIGRITMKGSALQVEQPTPESPCLR